MIQIALGDHDIRAFIIIEIFSILIIVGFSSTLKARKKAKIFNTLIPDRKFSVLDCQAVDLRRSNYRVNDRYLYFMKVLDGNGVKCSKEFKIYESEYKKLKKNNKCLVIKADRFIRLYLGIRGRYECRYWINT